MLWFVSTAYVPFPPRISNFHNSSGGVRVVFFEDFGLCKYQQPEAGGRRWGWNVEYGWWGQKDPVKQAVQSLIYTEWTFYEIFMDFQAFPTKMFTKICPNHHFPNFFTWNLFFEKCPPVIHKSLTFGFFSWRSPTMRHWNGSRFHPREGHQVRIFTARWCRTCGEWESR